MFVIFPTFSISILPTLNLACSLDNLLKGELGCLQWGYYGQRPRLNGSRIAPVCALLSCSYYVCTVVTAIVSSQVPRDASKPHIS